MTYIGLQFCYLISDTYVNNWIGLALASISAVLVLLWLPESPRFLHGRRRFDEARNVMNHIASVNGSQIQEGQVNLDTDPTAPSEPSLASSTEFVF